MKKIILLSLLAIVLSSCTIDVDIYEECEFLEHVVRDELGRIIDIYYEEVCYY